MRNKSSAKLIFLSWIKKANSGNEKGSEKLKVLEGVADEEQCISHILRLSTLVYPVEDSPAVNFLDGATVYFIKNEVIPREKIAEVYGIKSDEYDRKAITLRAAMDQILEENATLAVWEFERFEKELKPALVEAQIDLDKIFDAKCALRDNSRDDLASCSSAVVAAHNLAMIVGGSEVVAASAVIKAAVAPKNLTENKYLNYCKRFSNGLNWFNFISDSQPPEHDTESTTEFYVRLRGLPWEATVEHVLEFVKPVFVSHGSTLDPSKIHIIVGLHGRCTGEAFIELPSESLRNKLSRELHGALIGRRWVEVFKSSYLEYQQGQKRATWGPPSELNWHEGSAVLRLRGLPWGSTELDIMKFFEGGGFQIELKDITFPSAGKGTRSTGEAWVEFDSIPMAEEARRTLHRKCIGSRYIEIFSSTPREIELANSGTPPGRLHQTRVIHRTVPYASKASPASTSSGGSMLCESYDKSSLSTRKASTPTIIPYVPITAPLSVGTTDTEAVFTVLKMRGLPYGSNETHIVHFFSGFAMITILPNTVPIDGRPSGEAYVEFVSPQEALRAYQRKNGALVEHRYIELFPVSKTEMELAASGWDSREIRARFGGTASTTLRR